MRQSRRQFLAAAAAAPAALAVPGTEAAPSPDDVSALVTALAVTLATARRQLAQLEAVAPAAGPVCPPDGGEWAVLWRDLVACDVAVENAAASLWNGWYQEIGAALVAAGLRQPLPAMARQNA